MTPVAFATSAATVMTVATVAVALLLCDLVHRELGARPSAPGRGAARWRALVRPFAGYCRDWGFLTTGLFLGLVTVRFIALGT